MKKITILLSTMLLVLLAGSCKESFLDQEPPLYINEADIYTDADRIEATILGIYGTFKEGSFMGGKTYVALDNRGNDIINVDENNVTLRATYDMRVSATDSETYNAWYYAYLTINRINIFIESMESYNSIDVVGDVLYNRYIAEAKFLRGICYYYLCQLYSQPYSINPNAKAVPLRLTGIQESGHSDCPRSTIKEIYDQILSDVNDTSVNALPTTTNSYNAVTRASKAAGLMLRMRVLMAMENWGDAIKAGEAISGYTLANDVTSMFSSPYFTVESIFSIPMADTNRPNTQLGAVEYYGGGTPCAIDYVNGVMGIAAYSLPEDQRIISFQNGSELAKFTETDKLQWVPIFRYAETLLNLAECYMNNSQPDKAKEMLEIVRRRSIDEADDTIDISSLSGSALTNAVLNERRLELIGEGVRGPDLIRRGETYNKGQGATAFTISPSDGGYVWPIPEAERVNNNALND